MQLIDSRNFTIGSIIVLVAISSLISSTQVLAGSCCGCEQCASQAISRAKSNSVKAFGSLHSSILNLGRVFLSRSSNYSEAIYASASNITTQIDVDSRVEKQLFDALNAQQEIRSQQKATLERKRDLEESYNPETMAHNLKVAFASQGEFQTSEYGDFLNQHNELYNDLLKQKRNTLLSRYVINDDNIHDAQGLLWDGEIETAEDAAYVVFLTQQILFGGDTDPYKELFGKGIEGVSFNRDEAAFESGRISWANRIEPSIDFFSFDHGIRTRPDEEAPSVLGWLEININESLYNSDGLQNTYADASRADIYEALAIEQKKLNVVRYLNMQVEQLQERIQSSSIAWQHEKELKLLRYELNRTDFVDSTHGNLGG